MRLRRFFCLQNFRLFFPKKFLFPLLQFCFLFEIPLPILILEQEEIPESRVFSQRLNASHPQHSFPPILEIFWHLGLSIARFLFFFYAQLPLATLIQGQKECLRQ